MPTLNIQITGQATAPDGSSIPVAPGTAFVQRGPIVQVSISLNQTMAEQILQQGGTVPDPVSGLALIDTGASSTCIDDAAAQEMKLPVINTVKMSSASHAETDQPVYPISIFMAGMPIRLDAPTAIGANLKSQGLLALIGRDLLQHGVLVYNGTAGFFSLSL